jgi:hypothetical protein
MVFVMFAVALLLAALVLAVLLDEVDETAVTMVYFFESFNAALGLQQSST